jgi:AraC-like DNA-binding protein
MIAVIGVPLARIWEGEAMLRSQQEEKPRQFVLTTDAVAPKDRDAYWREAVCRTYAGLTITDWLRDGPVRGRLVTSPFADGIASECQQGAVKLVRDARDIAHSSGDHYNLVLQLKGEGRMRHAGHDCVRRPGDMTVMDSLLRYEGGFPGDLCVRVWTLPRRMLSPMLSVPEDGAGTTISGQAGVGLLLRTMLQGIWPNLGDFHVKEQRGLQDTLCRLTALALGARPETRETSRAAYHQALLQRALNLIERKLSDPTLTVEWVANHLRISRRQLEILFEGRGVGIAAWISRRRIEECRRQLEDPAQGHLSVATIAFLAGFADLSTFSRRFRAHYGATPRDIRGAMSAGTESPRSRSTCL